MNIYSFGLIACAFLMALSACSPPLLGAVGKPEEVDLNSPAEVIEGGVRLDSPDQEWDGYGEEVDIQDDVLVVGASEWNQCGPGSVYVYRRSEGGWREEARLAANDLAGFEEQAGQFEALRFGTSVSLGEGTLAVGAPGNSYAIAGGYTGAVYLYEYNGKSWVETAKISAERSDADVPAAAGISLCGRFKPRLFGSVVALDGDTLAVGGDAVTDAVYIYQRGASGWQEQARLPIPGMPGKDLYMASMDLFGDTLALSALYVLPRAEEDPVMSGNVIVYVFERSGSAWVESFRFVPEEGEKDLLFFPELNVGASVALEGAGSQAELLAVGLPGFPDWSGVTEDIAMFGANPEQIPEFPPSNRQAGAVYMIERDRQGWNQSTILRPAGWEDPPGVGKMFSEVPATSEGEQDGSAEGGLLSAAGIPELSLIHI